MQGTKNIDELTEIQRDNLVIAECIDHIISECVTHFKTSRVASSWEEECRYFYKTAEVKRFLKQFKDSGGKVKEIRIKKILDKYGEFDYYEVYRRRAEDRLYSKKINLKEECV